MSGAVMVFWPVVIIEHKQLPLLNDILSLNMALYCIFGAAFVFDFVGD